MPASKTTYATNIHTLSQLTLAPEDAESSIRYFPVWTMYSAMGLLL